MSDQNPTAWFFKGEEQPFAYVGNGRSGGAADVWWNIGQHVRDSHRMTRSKQTVWCTIRDSTDRNEMTFGGFGATFGNCTNHWPPHKFTNKVSGLSWADLS